MRQRTSNVNEKSDRNHQIFIAREQGAQVAELAETWGLSLPRIYRICLKEENKALKVQNADLLAELDKCKRK